MRPSQPRLEIPRELTHPPSLPEGEEEAPASSVTEISAERRSGICFRGMPEDQPVSSGAFPAKGFRERALSENSFNAKASFDDDETPTFPRFPTPRPFLRRIPVLRIALSELAALPLEPRAAFILSRIDGRMTIENILDVCAMPSPEAAGIIDELID